MKKGNWYFKQGRASGIIIGKCNGTETEINCVHFDHRYTEDGQVYKLNQILCREKKNAFQKIGQSCFSRQNNFGSFEIDQSGNYTPGLVAIVFDLGVGLVTSITEFAVSIVMLANLL